jgi:hypothetical protein
MEFTPICLDCQNFKKVDFCKYYDPIPFEIKNRQEKCPYYSGGDYNLIAKDAYKENK